MILLESPLPRICFGCTFCAQPECSLLHRHITEEYIYDKKPDWCPWVQSEYEGQITIDYEKIPEDTIIDLGFIDIDSYASIEEIEEDDTE